MAAKGRPLADAMPAILRALHEGAAVIEVGGDLRQRLNGNVLRKQALDATVERGVLDRRLGIYTATRAGERIGRTESERAGLPTTSSLPGWRELRGSTQLEPEN